MFKIEGFDIYLTRGDTAGFTVSFYNGETPYTLQEGDILRKYNKNNERGKIYGYLRS